MWGHLWASFGICGESSLWRSKKVVLSFPLGLGRSKLFSNLHTSTGTSDSKGAFDYSSRCMWRAVIPWDLPGAAWICATILQVIVISPLLAQLALLCLALHDTLFIDSSESYSFYFGCLSVYYSWMMLRERKRGWGPLKLSWVHENTSWAPLCFRPLATLPRTDFHQLGLFSWLFPLNSIPYSAPTG
jgi:hypothetical protein